MPTSIQAFRRGLFEENLEEASFLYTQCRLLRQKLGQPWRRIEGFEHRLELHLDCLVVGSDLALEVCRQRAPVGDFGEVYAAVSVYCRQQQSSLLAGILGKLDMSQPDMVTAVADGLKYELPQHWFAFVEQTLSRDSERLVPILASACGYRRIPCEQALTDVLQRMPSPPVALVEALGQLHAQPAQEGLKRLLSHADQGLKAAALLSLLRTGLQEPLRSHYLLAQKESWPHMALGLGGDASAAHVLTQSIELGPPDPNTLLALALLGMPSTLRPLYECLDNPVLADHAALALNWVCGANLYHDDFVAEPVNEDELFPRELKAWRQYQERPKAANGQPFGETTRKLSTQKDDWKRWFAENGSRFDPSLRYRNGLPVTPKVLLADLVSAHGNATMRRYTALELEIRYGCDVSFEVDMPVASQIRALRQMASWIQSQEGRFEAGRWYFNAALQ